MKIKLLVDSTFKLSKDYIEENNIEVIPLNVIIDGEAFLDGVNITISEVMEALDQGKKITTSQPSPHLFAEYFTRMRDEGVTDIICMTLSSTLSGTFQAANIASSNMTGVNIHLIDTLSGSVGSEMLARIVIDDLHNNVAIEDILIKINKIKQNAVILFTMENLTALKKSGRISRIKATIGNLLRVKPMIEYINGEVSINSKLRTETQVMEWIVNKMKVALSGITSKIHILLAHIRADEKVLRLKEYVSSAFPNINVRITDGITPVIAVNVGYGGIGVSWCYE